MRLRGKNVIGVYPDKLIQAGEVELCCFDKTGTLTISGMNVKSLMKNSENFGEEFDLPNN